ncbi:ABC transporter ATP-binding protein [Bacillus cytotoxicus]|uniref:ABC transporter ATP-binding protein n=1 Tax=Bacillus cytotoxicus TaxID=580165 RepID=A0ACC6A8J3_9BACI|nr:ABC transporter ATP-binding protein [Bacillus cytotoxicus]
MTLLQVNEVSKEYKGKQALSHFSLQVDEGACIVLCGGNGAGKSTLLHILAGISKPTEGTIVLNGIPLHENRNKYVAQIGYMPDDFHAQEMMTVHEFLSFYGVLRKVKQKQIQDILEKIGLSEKRDELVKHLSKGMRQRLVFGQALLGNPKLLLLDEPTNGLDPFWVNAFVEVLQDIKKKGTIVIFSTHMMDVAAEIGDCILFMKDGIVTNHIEHKGSKEEKTLHLLQLHRQG